MSEEVKPLSFMGFKLNDNGEVEGALPEIQHIKNEFYDRIIKEQEGYVYKECWKLNIDPNVLEKQIIEIKRLNYIIQQKDIQIEKMKCCQNCKHGKKNLEDLDFCQNCDRPYGDEVIKDEWELA